MGYVFISYSSQNQQEADKARAILQEENIACWMAPYDIPAGSKYAAVINDALESCSCLLLLLTESAQHSEFVYREIERAVTYRKTIIPMQLEDCQLTSAFKFYIGSSQIVAVRDLDKNSRAVEKVLKSVRFFVGAEQKQAENERKSKEEEECQRKIREEDERKRKEVEERQRKIGEEEERKRREEEERQRKIREEEERKRKEEEDRNAILNIGNYKDVGGGYVTFGTYPQSKKAGNVTISELFDNERGYYLGSDNSLYEEYKGEYYKVEPIKWKVLRLGGELFVVADDILDAHRFDESRKYYADSEIRGWLNDEFFQ